MITDQQFIKDQINGHSSIRINCPSCGGNNCFSASKVDGYIVYYCFRASCGLRGRINDESSIDDLRSSLSALSTKFKVRSGNLEVGQTQLYQTPNHFVSPLQNKSCYSILNRYSLIDFYVQQSELIRYDPKLDRLVFILKDHKGVIKGAVGRSLSYSNTPRWYVYGRINACPFIPASSSKQTDRCILVEDCISCCSLVDLVPSIALLGTAIPSECIQYLLPYDKLYIALDADATKKSIKLQKQLNAYKPTFIIPLRKDIKHYSPEEKLQLIKELDNG